MQTVRTELTRAYRPLIVVGFVMLLRDGCIPIATSTGIDAARVTKWVSKSRTPMLSINLCLPEDLRCNSGLMMLYGLMPEIRGPQTSSVRKTIQWYEELRSHSFCSFVGLIHDIALTCLSSIWGFCTLHHIGMEAWRKFVISV